MRNVYTRGLLVKGKQTWIRMSTGQFQGNVCDQKSGKFHLWMATASGANIISTKFWLIIVLPVEVKTYTALEIKFFVEVKNKVHVTIGNVCDFARNWVLHQNDFKVKIFWCFMEFCTEQDTDDGQHIYKQFHVFVWNSVSGISFDAIFCLVTFWKNFTIFTNFTISQFWLLKMLLKYQVTKWLFRNLPM